MTTGYNAFHVLKWALDMLATQVNLEVTDWYNVGFFGFIRVKYCRSIS